jgi:hypothetical protein
MAFITANTDQLRRTLVWSAGLKEALEDELMGQNYVRWLSDFPDGDTFKIPSIGGATVRDYVENTPVVYDPMDTGEFEFTINKYKSAATYITKKALQDGFYMSQLVSSFVPKHTRALMEQLETDILALAAAGASGGQTAADLNAINGVGHRFVASGSSQVITVKDFARARYALKKANVPDTNLIAIVDPSVEYTLNTLTNITDMSYNPKWEGLVTSGIASGMSFVRNIYGFDVYVNNRLPAAGANQSGAETIDSVACSANGVCNIFFSAAGGDLLPWVGAWRQNPEVESDYNKDFQREEYLVTARYGLKVYRPENMVVVISNSAVTT